MNIKRINQLPVADALAENTNVLIEADGSTQRIPADKIVPKGVVKTVNNTAPDENGNVNIEVPAPVTIDNTLTQSGQAADSAVVGKKVSKLSEEIENLKEEGGIGGNTGITITSKLVSMECDEGAELVVEGETTDEVTLVHCGKNLLPRFASQTTLYGVTITPNTDGSCTFDGTCTETQWPDIVPRSAPLHLPAGTYTFSAVNAAANLPVGLEATDGSFSVSVEDINTRRSFTIDEGKAVFVYFTIVSGATYENRTIYAQLEVGSEATNYEPHEKESMNGMLPMKLSAYEGINTLRTESGDTLIVTARRSFESIVAEAIKFDPSIWGLPVLALTGDVSAMTKDNSVDLAYSYGDMNGTCSVKWQGSSSLRYTKKNYTVKFDNAFEAVEGWGAQKKYCMKANWIDHSHARNVVNAKLWGQIVKSRSTVPDVFANLVNAGAIDGFPVIITLNGDFHGLYTFNIPKDGWMMGMGNGTQECILCAGNACPANGFKEAATLEGENDLEIEYITDENNTAWAKTSVNNLINACINSDGSDLDTTIAPMLDWQSAIDYYIFTVLVDGHDMTLKNYLLVTFDGTKWYFSGYDMDCTYGIHWDGSYWLPADSLPTFESYAYMHRVMELIKLYKKDALKARYAELRGTVLSESNIAVTFGNFCGKIPKPVYMQEANKWPLIPNTSTNDIAQIRDYYRMRVEYADKWIEELQ